MNSLLTVKKAELLKSRTETEKVVFCKGLFLSARWFAVCQAARRGINLIVLPDRESAEYCCSDLYNIVEGDRVFFLPSSAKGLERSNYKSSIEVQKTAAIERIINAKPEETLFVVSYPDALDGNIPSRGRISSSMLRLSPGQTISHDSITEILVSNGFEKVDFVSSPGQFALRGSIVDIFSFSFNYPFRISFWGDEIEKINTFDCNTQLSIEERESAEIVSGIFSAACDEGEPVTELFEGDTLVWFDSPDMYRDMPFRKRLESLDHVFIDMPLDSTEVDFIQFNISPQPVFNKNFELLSEDVRSRRESGYSVYIVGEKQSQLDRLYSVLSQNGGYLPKFVPGKNIHSGFVDNDSKVCIYSDHEIFDRFHRVNLRRSVEKSEQLTINDLNSFNIGDYVVHIDHGIGVFGGLVRMKDDMERIHEVVKITYRDGDVVFVSVNSLHKISLYRSSDGETPRINKLGSKTWMTLKAGAKSKVKDIAKDLIQLYARRKASKGFAFSADGYLQQELESSFIYEDTPDQELATKAVKQDMEDSCPMDRLICGDVGFGKTEIAVRAAFKAVCDSKQVAVLVPTTILALQHFNTFKSRLEGLPCRVEMISRLRTAGEIGRIKEDLRNGRVDILIGTHKILGGGIEFKDLGLLVIDEEQKFGVSAKEALRKLKSSVDTLTLTATPIPRTLQFSLLGARDLSIINTPPPNRIPVQTEIILFDKEEIRSIVNYELNRGGQVFFMHNKVEELEGLYNILHGLMPDVRICVAHGKMEARELENRILEFMRGDYDLLLCTTIIENGLDIPNANTIIINQAQNIGLSDLHQLRGRVGRSNRKAFCYLIVPPMTSITDDARRRLKAIEEFSDLGSGFNIAMQDLDIRGAGNLLGAEQSGFIMDMGFETYQKILSEAMEELGFETGIVTRTSKSRFVDDCTVETDQEALIPDEYLDITAEKIRIYKQLDSITSDREMDLLRSQISDRFGKMPRELENLFGVVRLRNIGASIGFEKVIVKNGMLIAFFVADSSSPYYQTETFASVLKNVGSMPELNLKQVDGKLKIVTRGVNSIDAAVAILNKLQ